MSAYDSIKKGLEEAIEYSQGKLDNNKVKIHKRYVLNVNSIRSKLKMTQKEFATTIGVGLPTIQKWETGVTKPRGTANTLLKLIDTSPAVILDTLSMSKKTTCHL
jgi:putative transcriptional regulator